MIFWMTLLPALQANLLFFAKSLLERSSSIARLVQLRMLKLPSTVVLAAAVSLRLVRNAIKWIGQERAFVVVVEPTQPTGNFPRSVFLLRDTIGNPTN